MTTLPLPTLTPIEAAILDAINDQFSAQRAYIYGGDRLPSLTTDHILVLVTRRYVADRLASGEVTIKGGRVVTRFISKRGDNLPALEAKTTTALEDRILTASDATQVGPFTYEPGASPSQDGDWYVAETNWTF